VGDLVASSTCTCTCTYKGEHHREDIMAIDNIRDGKKKYYGMNEKSSRFRE